ncbi:MAG: hypothetical protein U0518_04635 [Candidatus Gracilibacteria bacterium]
MPATLFIVYANGSIRSIGHNTQSEILSELLDEQDPRFPRENIIKMEFMQAGKTSFYERDAIIGNQRVMKDISIYSSHTALPWLST